MATQEQTPQRKAARSLYEATVTIRLRTWEQNSKRAESWANDLILDKLGRIIMDAPEISVERVVGAVERR